LETFAYLPKSAIGELFSFCEDVPEYGNLKAWQHLVDRLKICDILANNPLETYEVLCFARFFIEQLALTLKKSLE
jgi:hypothetical protein